MKGASKRFSAKHYKIICFHVSFQVALVDCLKAVGLEPDGIVGHSVGELGCAYADGGLTAEETVLAAYWRGRCVRDAKLPKGAMAAIGKDDE